MECFTNARFLVSRPFHAGASDALRAEPLEQSDPLPRPGRMTFFEGGDPCAARVSGEASNPAPRLAALQPEDVLALPRIEIDVDEL